MIQPRHIRQVRRLATVSSVAAVTAAIASLPPGVLPWQWLGALTAPAILLGLRRKPPSRPFLRALLATVLQLSACLLAYQSAGSISRPAALVGAILPPMVFVTLRRQDVDATLGLFLSLCVLLIGTILGQTDIPMLGIYVVAATMQLRCEAHLGAVLRGAINMRIPPTSRLRPTLAGIGLGVGCALAAFAVERSLGVLPSLGSEGDAAATESPTGPRNTGLSDSFVLEGGGELLNLRGEQLVEVQAIDGQPAPQGLYLRSGMFQRPGLDSWLVGLIETERLDASERSLQLREPLSGVPVRRLELVRTPQARDRVFTPAGLCSIYGLRELMVDRRRAWFRETRQLLGVYEVSYQQLESELDLPVDERWRSRRLTSVPDATRGHFQVLLDEWKPGGSPMRKARTIAMGLQRRCAYVRHEPTGPFDHAMLNFLHGDRTGFCMHFASAAAIMLRMVDVPCRIGVGLYGGSRSGQADSLVFGSQHAHASVEIPLQGRGWVILDPTPPAERGVNSPITPTLPDTDEEAALPTTQSNPEWLINAGEELLKSPWPWIAVIVLLILPLRRHEARTSTRSVHRAVRPARRWLLSILRELTNAGRPRPPGVTIEQHALALDRTGSLPTQLRAAFQAYQEVRFGGRKWSDEHEEHMRRGLTAARGLHRLKAEERQSPVGN